MAGLISRDKNGESRSLYKAVQTRQLAALCGASRLTTRAFIEYKRTETEEHVILTYQAYYLYLFIAALGVAAINNGYPSLGLQTITGFIWLFGGLFSTSAITGQRLQSCEWDSR